MSYFEYEARMYAWSLAKIDEEENMHKQAWLNVQAKATKSKGKGEVSVYEDFTDFYNKEEQVADIVNQMEPEEELSPQFKSMAQLASKANG